MSDACTRYRATLSPYERAEEVRLRTSPADKEVQDRRERVSRRIARRIPNLGLDIMDRRPMAVRLATARQEFARAERCGLLDTVSYLTRVRDWAMRHAHTG